MSSSSFGPFIGLGVDLIFFTIFYTWYKKINRSADEIKVKFVNFTVSSHIISRVICRDRDILQTSTADTIHKEGFCRQHRLRRILDFADTICKEGVYWDKKAPYRKLDEDLIKELSDAKSQYLAYACVEGEVVPVSQVLHSRHVEGQNGVIQHMTLTEHKSKRLQGVWTDVKNIIQDKIQTVPFALKRWLGKESNTEILVNEPTAANFLMGDLTITHDSFEPVESGNVVSRGLDRIFGEVNKGYHETEKMLLTNTLILGIGEIAFKDDKLQLQSPRNGQMYILTKMSRGEVIKKLEAKSFMVKFLMLSAGAVGVSILLHILYKQYKLWKSNRTREQFLAEARTLRQQTTEQEGDESYDSNSCVICLTNRREIVLLDCGHICLCAECVTVMPEPLTCPVCRSPVDRYITTYNP